MTNHHLDGATVMRYASGDLDAAFSVLVASHVALCPSCRSAVRAAEEMGGQILDEGDCAPMQAARFDSMMAWLDDEPDPAIRDCRAHLPASAERRDAAAQDSAVPAPLRRLIGADLDAIHWRTVAPGVRKHSLEADCDSSLYLLHIAPGRTIPEHGHGGAEMTLVLQGAYRDAFGLFGPGDVADLDEHVEHQPRVEPGEACICLVATEAPTRFKGFVGRLLQPLVGV